MATRKNPCGKKKTNPRKKRTAKQRANDKRLGEMARKRHAAKKKTARKRKSNPAVKYLVAVELRSGSPLGKIAFISTKGSGYGKGPLTITNVKSHAHTWATGKLALKAAESATQFPDVLNAAAVPVTLTIRQIKQAFRGK